jgi:Kef-type K+ transport system membrane component KefB
LLVLGFIVKNIASSFGLTIPDLSPILPILGTVGLILIVLEGALELQINTEKLPLVLKSSLVALIPILLLSFGIAQYFYYFHQLPFNIAIINAIPFAIISSSIAIPSARNLFVGDREFVTYESSLSDIIGVIFFNFFAANSEIASHSFGIFVLQVIIMLVISFVSTLLLAWFLNIIKHHIKFIPIIILVVLIYNIAKIYHLPALLFILIFGLFLSNIDELKHIEFFQKFPTVNFNNDVHKFKEITTELAFLIRSLFFILFGFLIDAAEVISTETILIALSFTIVIFVMRYFILFVFKIPTNPLVYIAPRGLITILLFLSIPESMQTPLLDKSLITQVIVLTSLVMMFGLISYKKPV